MAWNSQKEWRHSYVYIYRSDTASKDNIERASLKSHSYVYFSASKTTDLFFRKALNAGMVVFRIDLQGQIARFDIVACRSRVVVKQTESKRGFLYRDSWKNAYHCEGLYVSGRIVA